MKEYLGYRDGEIEKNPLFVYQEEEKGKPGGLRRTGAVFVQQGKLKRAGILDMKGSHFHLIRT